jgi:hypothetical protein
MQTVGFFNAFYNENKDKIGMPQLSKYPINYNAMGEWQVSLKK